MNENENENNVFETEVNRCKRGTTGDVKDASQKEMERITDFKAQISFPFS